MYRKIYIIGPPGSGKSYIARLLEISLNINAHELDHLYWDPNVNRYGIATDDITRTNMLNEIMDEPAWIMEGIYHDWTEPCFEQAEVIVLLTTNVWIRHWRLIKRYFRHKRKAYTGKRETFREIIQLLWWNHRYERKQLPEVMQALQPYIDKVRSFKTSGEAMSAVIRPL